MTEIARGTRRVAEAKRRWSRRRVHPPGTPPGTIHAREDARETTIDLVTYDRENLEEQLVEEVSTLTAIGDEGKVRWVDVVGMGDVEALRALGERFELHSLALEDAVSAQQIPKAEEYEDLLFIVSHAPHLVDDELELGQVAIFLRAGLVLTLRERPQVCVDRVRERLRRDRGRIRQAGADYLVYALLDAMIDSYFPVVETLGDRLDDIEERVLTRPAPEIIRDLLAAKRHLLRLRRLLFPQREALGLLLRQGEGVFVTDEVRIFLRDCQDHLVQLIDLVEILREFEASLLDIYLSVVSQRMNETMKVLTVIATIFIPLSFIAGVYGMNFDTRASPLNMPELGWPYGYPLALSLMAAVAAGLIFYFWRRGWLDRQ